MLHKYVIAFLSLFLLATPLQAKNHVRLVLDWYLNPDHGALIVAEQIGAFDKYDLEVEIIAPSDPNMGTRLVAAKQADLAISYQQQLYLYVEEQLPLLRVGTLIETPLNSLMALPDKGIQNPADLRGKTIGMSVSGVEDVLIETILKNQNLSIDDVTLINVNFNLVSALMTGRVDAVIGAYRNVEGNELRELGVEPVIMKVEDYGIPAYDELIIIAHKDTIGADKLSRFLAALSEGAAVMQQQPEQTWAQFAKDHPELNNDLNHHIWLQTAPLFAQNPFRLDREKYENYGAFLLGHGMISKQHVLDDYAVELTPPSLNEHHKF